MLIQHEIYRFSLDCSLPPLQTIAAIIADEAAIGVINRKTTAVRLIPAPGKKEGDMVEFGGLLGRAPVIAVHRESSRDFVAGSSGLT